MPRANPFKSDKKYQNALTDLGKCLKGLEKLGLIEYGFTPTQIRLTRRGKEDNGEPS